MALALMAGAVALDAVYLFGYRRGGRDALDCDFSAFVGGRVVWQGHGSTLLRSKLNLRPARNINIVSMTFRSSNRQPAQGPLR